MDGIKVSIYNLKMLITEHNIHICDSYKVTDRDYMDKILNMLREYMEDYYPSTDTPLLHRSNASMIREWVAHNNAYKIGFKQERVKDVDLNYPQPWYVSLLYWICSLIAL